MSPLHTLYRNAYMPVIRPTVQAPAFYEILLRSRNTAALFRPDLYVTGLCNDDLRTLYRMQLSGGT